MTIEDELRAEVERLRNVCQWWEGNRDSWFKAHEAAERALSAERAKVARVEAAKNTWAAELASGAIRDNGARYCWGQAVREIDDALAGDA